MKTFFLFGLSLLIILITTSNSQVRKIVLLEEATNSSCGDCVRGNIRIQNFFKSHFGGVISVRYHASWPSPDDPMYAINSVENDFRIRDYYGIFFVPDYFMDGIDYGEPLDSLVMIDQMNSHLSQNAPVKIKVSTNIDADSVRAIIKLIGVSPVLQTELKFRAAVIERMITYSTPPGSNGEKIFPDVMRKLLPDTSGFEIANINPGNEITYYVSCLVNPAWNWQDLAVVAWLQTDENRQEPGFWQTQNNEIIQSNISIPTYVIQSDSPLAEFISVNQNYSKALKIINDNDVDLHLLLKVTEAQVPAGWNYNFTFNNISFDSINVTINPGDSVAFGCNVNTNSSPGIIRLALFAQNLDDPYDYGFTANYLGVTIKENSDVLFIDDDGGGNSEIVYLELLDSLGIKYTCIDKNFVPPLMNQITNENFKVVIWGRSVGAQSLSSLDIKCLENYLESGGNLFIASSEAGLFWGWNNPFRDFCHNYLDAEHYGSFSSGSLLVGIDGTLGSGIITNLDGTYRGLLGSYSGISDSIFQYTGYTYTPNYGGLSYSNGTYKAVLLGVGLQQFSASSARRKLIQKVMNWFDIPVGVSDDENIVLNEFKLYQNYPNPFNPTTKISWQSPVSGRQFLRVFDVLGNEVSTLVNEYRPAGNYKVEFDATNLPSGVYFYQLKCGNYIDAKKMILLH